MLKNKLLKYLTNQILFLGPNQKLTMEQQKENLETLTMKQQKKEIIQALKKGNQIISIPKKFQEDEEIFLQAIMSHRGIGLFSESMRNNKKAILSAFTKFIQSGNQYLNLYDLFLDFSDNLKDDEELLWEIISKISYLGNVLIPLSQRLREDKIFVNKVVQREPKSFMGAGDKIRKDFNFIVEFYKSNNVFLLEYAHEEAKNSVELASSVLKLNGRFLGQFSPEIRSDRDMVILAVRQNGYSIDFASQELKNDPVIFLEAVRENPHSLKYSSEEIRKNQKIMMEAINIDFSSFEYADNSLKRNVEFIEETLKINGKCLKYVSKEMKENKEIALVALKYDPKSFKYCSDELQMDMEILWISNSRFKCIKEIPTQDIQFKFRRFLSDFVNF
jgi:hypothetical protein